VIPIRLSSAAERDIAEARAWYADQEPGLDLSFQNELDLALRLVQVHPIAFPSVHRSIRRVNLRRFPYSVFYIQRRDHIFVLAVVHHARSPGYWKRRW
jgi:plasmid stabilization system protein ParE